VIAATIIEINILFQIKSLPNIDQLSVTVVSGVLIKDLTMINIIGITTKIKVMTINGINNSQRLVVLIWTILSGVGFLDPNFIWITLFLI
jgi:hypothetical protein